MFPSENGGHRETGKWTTYDATTHYNGDPSTASGTDNSDFTVVQLGYTPADDDPLV